MSGYLLDTNVLSELRRRQPHEAVAAWWASVDETDAYVSVLTLGEIEQGIAKLTARDPIRAGKIDHWLDRMRDALGDRVLAIDDAVATAWGRTGVGRTLPVIDSLLAATANVHGLTFVTRNVRDAEGVAERVLDPFA